VTSIAEFGVFVEVEAGIEGLVYASEVSTRVDNIRDAVKIGEDVEALVVRVDPAEQKMALSMRAIEEREEREAIERVAAQARTQTATLGDRMPPELLERIDRDREES
jgi:small subunit ribosomal protein S1